MPEGPDLLTKLLLEATDVFVDDGGAILFILVGAGAGSGDDSV